MTSSISSATAPWLDVAKSYIGQHEIKGAKHNPFILKLWLLIRAPFTDDETPWCAGFVGGVLEQCGIQSTRSALARSYLHWGARTKPCVGAILVFERGPKSGHVGFYVSEDKDYFYVLGGNQGDSVNITKIAKSRLIDVRYPPGWVPGKPVWSTGSTISVSTNES